MKKTIIKCLIIFICTQCTFDPNNTEIYKDITIVELKGYEKCKIFLKHVVWGLTGDNSRTYISYSKNLSDTIKEPYFRALDFFYKLDKKKCQLLIFKSDSLQRRNLNKINIKIFEEDSIDYRNYKKNGFENIVYN